MGLENTNLLREIKVSWFYCGTKFLRSSHYNSQEFFYPLELTNTNTTAIPYLYLNLTSPRACFEFYYSILNHAPPNCDRPVLFSYC